MGRRSRKRRSPDGPAPGAAPPRDTLRAGYARGEARNEEIRRSLDPLEPGERPGAVTVAAIVALVLAVANVGLWLAGVEVSGREPNAGSTILQGVILLGAAAGMWRAKYWAVLGFQALLALTCIVAALSLMVASNLYAAALCLAILLGAGTLFWFLIRAMARIQMPERPGNVTRHG